MRIAFFVGAFPGLSETFILNQITGLLDRGHEVDVYGWPSEDEQHHEDVAEYNLMERAHTAPALPDSYLERAIKGGAVLGRLFLENVRVVRTLNVKRYGRLAASLRLLYASAPHVMDQKKTYDVAHCHFGQNGILALALRKLGFLSAKRVLTTFHGHDVYVDVPRYSSRLRRFLFEEGDGFTANSKYTAQSVVDLGGRREDIQILPVGFDVESFSYEPRSWEAGEPLRVLTVGRLVEKKGVQYAIRALANLRSDLSFEYRIVGGGPRRDKLEALVQTLDLKDDVSFLGALPREEVREQYQWAHIFTLPSVTATDGDREGQGLVLQEAQACGLPVIATQHNGFPEGVREGDSALLVPERNIGALADAFTYLVENKNSWIEMGKEGRELIEDEYDIEIINDRLVTVYKNI